MRGASTSVQAMKCSLCLEERRQSSAKAGGRYGVSLHAHTHNDISACSLSPNLSPDPNHCQFVGLAEEIRNPPCIIEGHPIPAVAKVIIPQPASLDTFWGPGRNQTLEILVIIISGFGPDTTVAIFIIVIVCCTSRG